MLSPFLRAVARAVAVVAATNPLVLAAPAHASDPVHGPTVNCNTYWRYSGVLVWGGVAIANPAHVGVRQLKLTCLYENSSGRYVSQNEAPAPVVVTTGTGLLAAGTMEWCGTATVIYEDSHRATTSTCS